MWLPHPSRSLIARRVGTVIANLLTCRLADLLSSRAEAARRRGRPQSRDPHSFLRANCATRRSQILPSPLDPHQRPSPGKPKQKSTPQRASLAGPKKVKPNAPPRKSARSPLAATHPRNRPRSSLDECFGLFAAIENHSRRIDGYLPTCRDESTSHEPALRLPALAL